MSEHTNLFVWNNQNLFSNNYLEYHLPISSLWKKYEEKAITAFAQIKNLYEVIKPLNFGPGEESELEDKFIKPILSALGYAYHVQPITQRGFKKKRPDYALFKDTDSYKSARKHYKEQKKLFSHALTILEAKYWGRRLNDADKNDILDSRDPTAQTVKYLEDVHLHTDGKINWAILTNGREWRLFYYRATSRSGNFYEINLEEIITKNKIGDFLYFYLFFSKDAFIPDPVTGKTSLDLHLKGSEDYAVRVSAKLKDLIFDHVFEGLASGFLHYRKTELAITKEDSEARKDIFKGCLTLLYRILFLLYAESRSLLPVSEEGYNKVSLSKLKKDIYQDISTLGIEKMNKKSYMYWAKLEGLFNIIAKGDSTINVPIYNGGLFETNVNSFLSKHKMPDPFLAEAMELLTVDHEGEYTPDTIPFIDYSSLDVRHLGDIYEGLLEFHIQIAEEDIFEIKKDGKSIWQKVSEVKAGTKTYRKKTKGEVYIENSKHERKATGSYYTPHYIVEYIVKNTVGPVLEERLKVAEGLLSQLEDATKRLRKQNTTSGIQGYRAKIKELEDSIVNTIFDIKVLDPAMGSGHFLVHTVDFISDRIIAFLADYPENPVIKKIEELRKEILEEVKRQGVKIDEGKLTEVNLIKRMVMKRCIYGVDLNDMAVELAKLSLWLDSFTLGTPLSFLDHHLKCGNSLIGILDISDVIIPGTESYGKVQRALSFMHQVSELTDSTISEAQKSYDLFSYAQKEIEPIRRRFDVATAKYFTDLGKKVDHLEQLAYTMSFDKEPWPENIEKCKRALSIAKEKRFFHWKLEFPEVFYAEKGEKENPGFDCVIGNPPYAGFHGFEDIKSYLNQTFQSCSGKYDIYIPFIELSTRVLRKKGILSYICPSGFMKRAHGKQLRKLLSFQAQINFLHDFRDYQVFSGATNYTCIFSILNNPMVGNYDFKSSFGSNLYTKAVLLNTKDTLFDESWNITGDNFLVNVSSKNTLQLKDIASIIAEGIVTGQNEVFLINKTDSTKLYDGLIFNENKVLKKALKGSTVNRYEIIWDETYLIYPYKLSNNKTVPLSENELKEHTATYNYLIKMKDKLKGRSYFDSSSKQWYELWNQRNILHQLTQKIVVQENSMRNEFVIDKGNYFYLDTCCGISIKKEAGLSDFYVLTVLNSKLLDFIFKQITVPKAGGHYIHKPMFLERLPVPRISFTTPAKERKKRVDEIIRLYQSEINTIAINADKWQNKNEAERDEKGRNKKSSTSSRKMAGGTRKYKLSEKGISGKDFGLGSKIHGVREGTGKYEPSEGTPQEGEDSTHRVDSTRYFETAEGIKSYSEVSEIIAVSVTKTLEAIIDKTPEDIHITPEWICKLHNDIAGLLFPDWAGRLRDINVTVGTHIPPPFYEVPVHVRLYCEDLTTRLSFALREKNIEKISETLAFADWRFQWIHPFKDFNGRVGRIILSALLFKLRLPPTETASIEPKEKERYLKALRSADTGDISLLTEIWIERLSKAFKERGEM